MRLGLVCMLGLWLASCEVTSCRDVDRDGYGLHCASGPDCDDTNPTRIDNCNTVAPPDCSADPSSTGCPCQRGGLTRCYPGDPTSEGVGRCRAGRTECGTGFWGLCQDAVLPRFESCNGLDDDCDGRTDEGVRSPCGDCLATCVGTIWGEPFTSSDLSDGLALTRTGDLTLARTEIDYGALWVANSGEGTISKIDIDSAVEVARYATGDHADTEPSRVAVDTRGDAWVANRDFERVSTIVHIAGAIDRCIDSNGNGRIETSSGGSDVLPFGSDECVLESVPVGAEREVARAIAIEERRGPDLEFDDRIWVGLDEGEAFIELSSQHEVLRRIETPGFKPYSALFDPWGILWAIERDGYILRLDPRSERMDIQPVPLACWQLYGLAIASDGRIVMTGFSCDRITLYDPSTEQWSSITGLVSPRGATWDETGIWVARTGGEISRVDLDPLSIAQHVSLESLAIRPLDTVGIAGDSRGSIWAISGLDALAVQRPSVDDGGLADDGGLVDAGRLFDATLSNANPLLDGSLSAADAAETIGPDVDDNGLQRGVVTRVDAASGVVLAQIPVGLAPHTQGDLIGTQRFGRLAPRGATTYRVPNCDGLETRWHRLHVVLAGDSESVQIEVRHAATAELLADAAWSAVRNSTSPIDLEVPDDDLLELRVTLRLVPNSPPPRLRRVGVERDCGVLE